MAINIIRKQLILSNKSNKPSIKSLTQHFANLINYSVNHCNFILLSEAELSNAGEQLD